jgi:ABC-2 type transport system permease protein
MEVSRMEKVTDGGILSGLRNLVNMEAGRWIKSHRWLTNILIYLSTFQFFIIVNITGNPYKAMTRLGLWQLVNLVPIFIPIAVVVLLQNEVIKEKESGTMAWVLTSPVSRSTFIIAKTLVNVFWALTLTVIIEFASCWFIFPVLSQRLPSIDVYLATMGVYMLYSLFFITLTILLGCLLKSRGGVIGLPLMYLLAETWFKESLAKNGLGEYLPMGLSNVAGAWLSGGQMDYIVPVAAVSAWCILFVAASIWRIRREQF